MKLKLFTASSLLSALIVGLISCTDNSMDVKPSPVELKLTGAEQDPYFSLGRVLFYDSHLSVNNAISCGSCHKQALAFSDDVPHSRGFENRLTARNTLPIQNLNNSFTMIDPIGQSFGTKLFWDGREQILSNMVLMPILNHVEMGMSDANAIVDKIRNLPYYHDLFVNAFGDSRVDQSRIAGALTFFVQNIQSFRSRFDRSQAGQSTLSALELQGKDLFFAKYNCNSCHQTQLSNGYESGGGFVNIGLDVNYTDPGLSGVTNQSSDVGKFKIPNLRNVALTAPYMHDGRFTTLDQVLNHYKQGIQNHPNLDPRLRNSSGSPLQMNISDQEKGAIIAFLNTLTDYSMITAPELSNPFTAQ